MAAELAAAGSAVALDHLPGRGDDAAAELTALVAGVRAGGTAPADCELTVPVDRLGRRAPASSPRCRRGGAGRRARRPGRAVDPLLADLPGARGRRLCGRAGRGGALPGARRPRVRLRAGRGGGRGLAFVRCLDVLMAGDGRPPSPRPIPD